MAHPEPIETHRPEPVHPVWWMLPISFSVGLKLAFPDCALARASPCNQTSGPPVIEMLTVGIDGPGR